MKLLILSNYFPPDLSAGSFRMQGLVEALERWKSANIEVDLVTTRPNRYASHHAEAPIFEDHGWLRIHRIELPPHEGGMVDQARAYAHFVTGARAIAKNASWDAVFATSSRLMTSALGAYISKRQRIPLFLDIRDLFTDNMGELLSGNPLKLLMPAFRAIERMAIRQATRVNVVSVGFVEHIRSINPKVPISVLTNGIDTIFLDADFSQPRVGRKRPLVLYAGNMGEGQGLHRILPAAARALSGEVDFRLIGDGGRKKHLANALAATAVDNVELAPPVPRAQLIDHYREADILFLHLNDLDAFHKVLPSKLFEYGATGKPIVAGVQRVAKEFSKEHLSETELFEPLDSQGMVAAIRRACAKPSLADRAVFRATFARSAIMTKLASEIVEMLQSGGRK